MPNNVAYFTNEINPSLAKAPWNFNYDLGILEYTSFTQYNRLQKGNNEHYGKKDYKLMIHSYKDNKISTPIKFSSKSDKKYSF